MENNAGGRNEALSPQEESAKVAILAECDKLTEAGVTFVAVHFDGYGDDGTTEEVKCYDSEFYASIPMNRSRAGANSVDTLESESATR
jgi:hypothetical protein